MRCIYRTLIERMTLLLHSCTHSYYNVLSPGNFIISVGEFTMIYDVTFLVPRWPLLTGFTVQVHHGRSVRLLVEECTGVLQDSW